MIKLFEKYDKGIYRIIKIFGIKITIKVNSERIDRIAWWIPIKKWRDNFRNKFNSN